MSEIGRPSPPSAGPPAGPPPSRGAIDADWLRKLAGRTIAAYVRLMMATSRRIEEPADQHARNRALGPAIYVSWHANILATPAMCPDIDQIVGMASPHPDGKMAGYFAESFGTTIVYGTGMSHRQVHGTGGMAAFRGLLRALRNGKSVYLCGEVPPVPGRAVSLGVVALSRKSGRPIVPVAAASSRRTVLEKLWDRMQINHPFSRLALVSGEPFHAEAYATDEEAARALKPILDGVLERAFALADGRDV